MRIASVLLPSYIGLNVGLAAAQFVLPFQFDLPSIRKANSPSRQQGQAPLMPMPPFLGGGKDSGDDKSGSGDRPRGDLMISDILNTQRNINIFAGFTRDIDAVSKRIDDASKNSTILAPLNSEIQKLPRKPWEDPKDYEAMGAKAYEGQDGESRAHRNLRRFVEAHVVNSSPWAENEEGKAVGGGTLKWQSKDGKKLVQPGDIEVVQELETSNGQVWIIKGVINYASES